MHWSMVGVHLRSGQLRSPNLQTQVREEQALVTMRMILVTIDILPQGPFASSWTQQAPLCSPQPTQAKPSLETQHDEQCCPSRSIAALFEQRRPLEATSSFSWKAVLDNQCVPRQTMPSSSSKATLLKHRCPLRATSSSSSSSIATASSRQP